MDPGKVSQPSAFRMVMEHGHCESFWCGLHSDGINIQAYLKADERDSSER
jgi:hypothetical protein